MSPHTPVGAGTPTRPPRASGDEPYHKRRVKTQRESAPRERG